MNKRRRKLTYLSEASAADEDQSTCHEDLIVDLLFRPRRSRLTVAASIYRGQLDDGSFASIPRLSINVTVPEDSEIFAHLWNGRLDEVKRLLADGKASLRDHDEVQGWSVIYVRDTYSCSSTIGRYLMLISPLSTASDMSTHVGFLSSTERM